MQPDNLQKLEDLFFRALSVPVGERQAWIEQATTGDDDLAAELEAMLGAHAAASADADTGAEASSHREPGPDRTGERLGAYRLLARIGAGGMGEVYHGERVDGGYEQDVAVKLVRSHLMDDEVLSRFRVERQILARLDHPNIATLLDGGVASDGRPYLVMPYVDGSPITRFAEGRGLDVEARLRLFATVCRAVHYAHTNLVVHRDLKPSNILVTGDGQVRLLDFGIAKLLDPGDSELTLPVTEDLLLLTPEHAAPEQILGEAVTTATDTWALGVLLYELLTGERPFREAGGLALSRAVCERDPVRPSDAVPPTSRSARATLRGDLDQITLMALRKEPERRYATAGELADDVERYLAGRPVRAHADSVGYRVRKLVHRNPLATAGVAAFAALLIVSVIAISFQSRARAQALEVAQQERDVTARLADFMVGVFDANDPARTRGGTITARELLDDAAARLESDLTDQPEVQADMAVAMGRAYGGLGFAEQSSQLFGRALELRRSLVPPDEAAIAEAQSELAFSQAAMGEHRTAIALLDSAIVLQERAFGPANDGLAEMLARTGRMRVDVGAWEEAWERLDRAESIQRAQRPVDAEALAQTLRSKFVVAEGLGRDPEEWLELTSEALALVSETLHEDDPTRLNVLEDYALTLQGVGMIDSALAVHREVLGRRRRVHRPNHPDIAFSLYNIGRGIGRDAGRWAESLPYLEEALALREQAYGPGHDQVGRTLHSIAVATGMSGDLETAAQYERRAVPIHEATLGEAHIDTLNAMSFLAQLESLLGNRERTLELLEQLLDRGWTGGEILDNPPFDGVREDPRFQRLREQLMVGVGG